MKTGQVLPKTKIFRISIAQENYFQRAIAKTGHNPLILLIFAKDHQFDEIHKSNHKIEIADPTVK